MEGLIRYLLDTNLLLYPLDPRDPGKRAQAKALLRRLARRDSAALPVQALSEFASIALRKLTPPLSPEATARQMEGLLLAFPALPLTPPVVLEALRGVDRHGFSYLGAPPDQKGGVG